MTINENATVESILEYALREVDDYFNDWKTATTKNDEFNKVRAYGQIEGVLRIIRRIDPEKFTELTKKHEAARAALKSEGANLHDA